MYVNRSGGGVMVHLQYHMDWIMRHSNRYDALSMSMAVVLELSINLLLL